METFEPGRAVADLLTVRRVFGEPVSRDGVTVIPVARVMGGSGGGSGSAPAARRPEDVTDAGTDGGTADVESSGSGGGVGMRVTPVGVYVLDGSQVTWQPALDLQRVVSGGMALGALAILTVLVGILRR
ncbi:spore germination protein GerW family protein [Actinotalea sp. Marseille-Q4924]|uniref:spore germination protein GerW family protein n=1 Tax=Actinotalea sp. Marseille-Q4924 TaxID=2866571 RepID=UPI001CE3E7D0|nr:spore germination protein GerW family protein [Actinotalea sp. Marseille-Q4924]